MKNLLCFLLLAILQLKIVALSTSSIASIQSKDLRRVVSFSRMTSLRLRGGESETENTVDEVVGNEGAELPAPVPMRSGAAAVSGISTIATLCGSMGKLYSSQLVIRPIITKSWTAGIIFALSDYLAQRIESKEETSFNTKRVVFAAMVGTLYFAPAAHYWYEAIFRFLPGKGFLSILQKALMGQLIFGPSFTCIFFASSLMQNGTFSFANWGKKIKNDLPGAWLAGSAFWPIVDVISYSVVPISLIPLFINICSLVWTIYLSIVANGN